MHRGIMVYGPADRIKLMMAMEKYSEAGNRSNEIVLCHKFEQNVAAELMFTQITDMIQRVQGSVGKDFTDSFMVMPLDEVASPWFNNYGEGQYVLGYKLRKEYHLFYILRNTLYDWFEPGGRWATYLRAKDPATPDAHIHHISPDVLELTPFKKIYGQVVENNWSSLMVKDVDWEATGEGAERGEDIAITMRTELKAKGVEVPTYREFFFTTYAEELAKVNPDEIEGILAARRWDLYFAYEKMITELRAANGYPPAPFLALDQLRWSDELLTRLHAHRAKLLSCWIIGDVVYDLDDMLQPETHFHKGLDALEAMDPETIVSVVDVHY